MYRAIPGLICALMLSGCVTTQQAGGEPVPLDRLILQIKSDIAAYNAEAAAGHAPPLTNACRGQIDFTIKSVKVTVATTAKMTENGTLGADVTPYPFLGTKANFGVSRALANSQTLTFALIPVASARNSSAGAAGSVVSVPPSQLVTVLMGLRNSLLAGSNQTPCFTFPPDKDQDNSIEFGFTATNGEGSGAIVNLWVFAIGANRSTERTAANTIKISFIGHGEAFQ